MQTAMIVDDHPFIRSTLKMILKEKQFKVIAEADNGSDALQLARQHNPNLILLDISMPKVDGLVVLKRMLDANPSLKIIMMTSLSPTLFSMRCMNAGAQAYVSKTGDLNELTSAINAVMSGHLFFPNVTTNTVHQRHEHAAELELIHRLGTRELMVLQQLAKGLSNQQIAEDMLLSSKTISTYKARIVEKLNVSSVVHLADLAKRHALI